MTYDELQAFGAMAGWPRCKNTSSNRSCNRLFDPAWPNSWSQHGFCPLDVVKKVDHSTDCSDMSDDEWLTRMQMQLKDVEL
jgi:hypothetical protein